MKRLIDYFNRLFRSGRMRNNRLFKVQFDNRTRHYNNFALATDIARSLSIDNGEATVSEVKWDQYGAEVKVDHIVTYDGGAIQRSVRC